MLTASAMRASRPVPCPRFFWGLSIMRKPGCGRDAVTRPSPDTALVFRLSGESTGTPVAFAAADPGTVSAPLAFESRTHVTHSYVPTLTTSPRTSATPSSLFVTRARGRSSPLPQTPLIACRIAASISSRCGTLFRDHTGVRALAATPKVRRLPFSVVTTSDDLPTESTEAMS